MIDAALQEQADRRAGYVRLAFRTFTEARERHDNGDSMSMAVEAIRPVIEADERERCAKIAETCWSEFSSKPEQTLLNDRRDIAAAIRNF